MATEAGSMSQLLDRLAKTDDLKTISELSREIMEGARQVRVKLDDPTAFHYPFTFRKGDVVARQLDFNTVDPQSKGQIVDGLYEGSERPGGPYTIIYTVERDDGVRYDARDLHLLHVVAADHWGDLPDKYAMLKAIVDKIEPGWVIVKPDPLNPRDIEHEIIFQHPSGYREARVHIDNSLFHDPSQRQRLADLVSEAIHRAKKRAI